MAQLSSVLGSILRDIITAQHEANIYSLSLSDAYGRDGKVKDFPLPNVVISDMELDLKYGIKSTEGNQEMQNLRLVRFRLFMKELCDEAAKTAISSIVSTVLSSDIKRGEEELKFFVHLKQQNELNKKFRTFLKNNMRMAFDSHLLKALDEKTGKVKVDVVTEQLMNVVMKKFVMDSELENLFEGTDGAQLKKQIEKEAKIAIENLVVTMTEGRDFKRTKNYPQIDVAVTVDELEKMPEEAIHSFKLKFSPTNCTITDLDNDEYDDFNML